MSGYSGDGYTARVQVELLSPEGEVRSLHDYEVVLPRISDISKIIDKSDQLLGWAYNSGLEGMLAFAEAEVDFSGWDLSAAKEAMKQAGYSPFVRRGAAADRGSRAHDTLEMCARGDPELEIHRFIDKVPKENQGYCWAAVDWYAHEAPEPILVEESVVSLQHGFAGTLDLYSKRGEPTVGKGLVLTDAKTSKDVYPEMAMQLGGYAIALEELGFPVDTASILLLRADGTYKEVFLEPDRAAFLHALDLYRSFTQTKAAVKAAKEEA